MVTKEDIKREFDYLLKVLTSKWMFAGICLIGAGHFVHLLWGHPIKVDAGEVTWHIGLIGFISLILEHLGMAVFVSMFVGWTIDFAHRKKMEKQFTNMLGTFKNDADNMLGEFTTTTETALASYKSSAAESLEVFRRNAFKAVYQWVIPRAFLEAVDDQIFSSKVVRNSWDATYKLQNFTDQERRDILAVKPGFPLHRRLVVDALYQGVIENKSSHPMEVPMEYHVERQDADFFNRCTFIEVAEVNGSVVDGYNEDQLEEFRKRIEAERAASDKGRLVINHIYRTPPVHMKPGGKYHVTIGGRYIRSRSNAREVMTIMSMVKKVKVSIESEIKNLKLNGELLSPHSFRRSQFGNRCTYISNNPLLPHQGYMIWWHTNCEGEPICGDCAFDSDKPTHQDKAGQPEKHKELEKNEVANEAEQEGSLEGQQS